MNTIQITPILSPKEKNIRGKIFLKLWKLFVMIVTGWKEYEGSFKGIEVPGDPSAPLTTNRLVLL
jgi:hypothetical protein